MRILIAIVLCGACAHSVRSREPTPSERALAQGLEEIAYRGGGPAQVAGMRLARTDGAGVLAVPDQAAPPASRPSRADDVRIESAVRGAISADPLLAPMDIDVDVDAGRVRFTGDLVGPEQAARALEIALSTEGVVSAESRCTWVTNQDHVRLVGRAVRRNY